MNRYGHNTVITAIVVLLAMAVSNGAGARPNFGGSCTDCHDNPGGSLTSFPDPLNINVGSNGLMTFTVTSLGESDSTAISVQGLENPLLASSIGSGGNTTWTHQDGTYGMSYTTPVLETGQYTLDLVIGSSATPDTYPIVVMYAGNGKRGTETGFDLLISLAGVSGDYDASGQVAQGDLDLVLLNWGKTVPPDPVPDGWVNQQPSGLIGQSALDGVLLNWGNTAGSGAALGSASTIPEPATAVMFIVGTLVIFYSLARPSPHCCQGP